MEQRRFALMGQNLFLVTAKFMRNQNICRLLHYTDRDPLAITKANVNGIELINKNILVVPKPPDDLLTKESFLIVSLDSIYINPTNKEFKVGSIQITILCPFEEWLLDTNSLRPYLLMQEVDIELNEQKIKGIGNLTFVGASQLAFSPQLGGFTMEYKNNEFN